MQEMHDFSKRLSLKQELYSKKFDKHLEKIDDPTLLVLKGHLLIEEILEEIISSYCESPEIILEMNIGFYNKMKLAQSLVGKNVLQKDVMLMIENLNSLRNELAHKLEGEKLDQKISKFLESIYRASEAKPEITDLKGAINYIVGFFSAFGSVISDPDFKKEILKK